MKKLFLLTGILIIALNVLSQHFEVDNTEGCDSLTVAVTNLHPSNGYSPQFMVTTGFNYSWDFGSQGTSSLENPDPVTFTQLGPHEIGYNVVIDTIGYKVTGVSLSGHLGCDDSTPFDNTTEIYIRILDNSGNVLLDLEDDHDSYQTEEGELINLNFIFNEFHAGYNMPLWIQILDYDSIDANDNCIDDEEAGAQVAIIPPANNINGFGENDVIVNTTTTGGELTVTVSFNKPVLSFNDSETVTVNPLPSAPVLDITEINMCPSQTMPTVTASGTDIKWYDNPDLVTPIETGESYTPTATELGEYTYYATQTNATTGCESQYSTLTLNIGNIDGPSVQTYNEVYCQNEVFQYIIAEGFNIIWYSDETLTNMIHQGDSLDISVLGEGDYAYFVTSTNEDQTCSSLATEVNFSILPGVEANITITDANCYYDQSGSAQLEITNGEEPYEFLWSNGSTSQNLENAERGEYTLTILDNNFCSTIFDVVIDSPDELSIDFSVLSGNCFTDPAAEIEALVSGGVNPYTYEWDNGTPDAVNSNLETGGTYTVTVTDYNSCTYSESYDLEQATEIIVVTSSTNESCPGLSDGSASINVSGGMQPYIYNWDNGDSDTTINDVVAGTFSVTVTDFYNCTVTSEISISNTYDLCLVPSNVITPNGDGKNDYWKIEYIELYPSATVQVFDRTGRIVFESTGYDTQFNGTFNGKILPIGSYFYVINLNNESEPMKGFLDIIR